MSDFLSLTKQRPSTVFEYGLLADEEKLQLCRSLLAEFGVTRVNVTTSGEMIHSCALPFGLHAHGDSHPSASLNYKKLAFKCLGCGCSGGLLWFIAVCRGTSADESRSWLSSTTGQGPDGQSLSSLLDFFDAVYAPSALTRPPLPSLSPRILDPWMLIHPYMTEYRHIPVKTLVDFRVGYNPETDRIVIPHFWNESLVGWQTRRLGGDGPKYKSSVDLPKDSTIYHYSPGGDAVVVESPMSVLSKHHIVPNMEATFGASVTDTQIRLLAEHHTVTLWFDQDKAGWKATTEVGEALTPYSSVWVVDCNWAADPADMDDQTVKELLASAVPFSAWSPPTELREWSDGA